MTLAMRRLALALIALFGVVAASTADARTAPTSVASGTTVALGHMATGNGRMAQVTLWLPAGYARGHQRYRVLYVLDGAPVAPPAASLRRVAERRPLDLRTAAARLLADPQSGLDPAIIVGIALPDADRTAAYLPAPLIARMPADVRQQLAAATGEQAASDTYLGFIKDKLKAMIDRKYRTRADPAHTTIVGEGPGAVLALYALAEYPGTFGSAACLSLPWPLIADRTDVPVPRPDTLRAWAEYIVTRLGRPDGRRLWFGHGDQGPERTLGAYQSKLDIVLGGIGWQIDGELQSRVYSSTGSDNARYAARLDDMLGWLLKLPPQ